MKKLPPFGHTVPGDCHEVRIYVGTEAWTKATHCYVNFGRMLLPDGEPPESYSWPVAGRDALIFQVGEINDDIVRRLVRECLRQGAGVVRVFDRSNKLTVHRVNHAAA